MAMSIIAKPYSFFPAYNYMRFIVDSTNKNSTAFEYIFQVFASGTSNEIARYSVKPRFGDGYGQIDLSELLSSKLLSEIENASATSYFDASRSYYNYDVKIGERFISNVSYTSALTNSSGFVRVNVTHSYSIGDQIYISQTDGGTANPVLEGYQTITSVGVGFFIVNVLWSTVTNANIDGSIRYADNRRTQTLNIVSTLDNYVFNGVFDSVGINLYNPTTYDLTSATDRPLTMLPTEGYTIGQNAPLLLNFRTQGGSGAIRFQNSNGDILDLNLIGSGEITTVNCGTFNTPTLSVVSGTLPLVKPTTTFYDVWYQDAGQKSVKTRIYIQQGCEIDPYSIVFVDKLGSLVSLPFTLKSRESMDVKKETYNREQDGLVSGSMWQNKIIEGGITQVNLSQMKKLQLEAPYVNDVMSELYYQMHASPSILLFDGVYFYPVTLDNTNVTKQRLKVDRKNRYSVTVSFSNNEKVNG